MPADYPEEIADELLYETGNAADTGDFERFMKCFHLPYQLETMQHKRIVRTQQEMRDIFEKFISTRAEIGVSSIVRAVVSAEYFSPTIIRSTHVARNYDETGAPIGAPYPVLSILNQMTDGWKITASLYATIEQSNIMNFLEKE